MKATGQLRDEHGGIKVMLDVMERVCDTLKTTGGIDTEHFDGILEFLKVFVDKCHHGKEEELLFPALVAAGIPDGSEDVALRRRRMRIEAMSSHHADPQLERYLSERQRQSERQRETEWDRA